MGRKLEFDLDRTLHRAMKIFWQKGYDATSMQDLVDGLGINRFSIYNSLGDKKSLFIKSLAHYRSTVLAKLLAPLHTEKHPKQRLLDYIEFMGEQIASDAGHLGCMVQNTSTGSAVRDEDVAVALDSLFGDISQSILSAVEAAIDSQEIHENSNSNDLSWFIISHLQGLIILRKTTRDSDFIFGQITMLKKIVLEW